MKFFKGFLLVFLGFVIGLLSVAGAVVGGLWYAYTKVTVGTVTGNQYKEEIGDVNEFTLSDMVNLARSASAAPDNYTFRKLDEKYRFDLVALINKLGGNIIESGENGENEPYIDDLRSVSLFKLTSSGGFKNFLDELPMGAILSFMKPTALFDYDARAKLRAYTVGDMTKTDEETGKAGYVTALGDVSVGSVLPALFEKAEDGSYRVKNETESNKIMTLLSNVRLGGLLNATTSDYDFGKEVVEGGFSYMGNMPVDEFFESLGMRGEFVKRLTVALDGKKFGDLFSKDPETGKYNFGADEVLEDIKLGELLGYEQKDDGKWYKSDGTVVEEHGAEGQISKSMFSASLKTLMAEDFEIADLFEDVYLGGLMGLYRCAEVDGEIVCELGHGDGEHTLGGWYSKKEVGGETVYTLENAVTQRVADKAMSDVMTDGLDLTQLMQGLTIGETMGYKKVDGIWCNKAGKRLDKIESITADVDLGAVLGGSFRFTSTINSVRIGEIMNYHYCDGTEEGCDAFEFEDGVKVYHPSHEEGWYKKTETGWEKVDSNIINCVAGFTVEDVGKPDFSDNLMNKINSTVTVKDIFGDVEGTNSPLSIVGNDVKIGELQTVLPDKVNNSTLGTLIQAGLISLSADTVDSMNGTFTQNMKYVLRKPEWYGGTSGNVYQTAYRINGNSSDHTLVTPAKGAEFWRALKVEEALSVLLTTSDHVAEIAALGL